MRTRERQRLARSQTRLKASQLKNKDFETNHVRRANVTQARLVRPGPKQADPAGPKTGRSDDRCAHSKGQ